MTSSTSDTQPRNSMLTTAAYILGKSRFRGLDFIVNENVLVPRFETELLVDTVIKYGGTRVLDMCTGSGCIAVTLALAGKDVSAADISQPALDVAKSNAQRHGVFIDFIQGDMFANINGKYDVIVSNPPYLREDEIGVEDKQTLKEPKIALDGGEDGLLFYRTIAREAGKYLVDGGMLALEIGHMQGDAVSGLLRTNNWGNIEVIKDDGNRDRVIVCWKN